MAVRRAERTPGVGPVPVVGAWHVGSGGRGNVPVEGKVLVELMHIEGLHVGDDVGAQLRDVHIAEVDVLPPPAAVH